MAVKSKKVDDCRGMIGSRMVVGAGNCSVFGEAAKVAGATL
jgi:hypothetical protein